MQRIIYFVITLSFAVSNTLAAFGDVRISEGHRSGRLEFQNSDGNWGTVCRGGFNNDAGDVACRQLGYVGSSDVYSYTYYYNSPATLCRAYCEGDEDKLQDCTLYTATDCSCYGDIVGITCTNSLTAGQIAGIVIGVVVFIGLLTTIAILCICCLIPTCPCYYRNYRATQTVVVTQRTPPVVTTAMTTNYQGPSAYDVDTGYQPYPAAAPPTATAGK